MSQSWCSARFLTFFLLIIPSYTLPSDNFQYYDDHKTSQRLLNLDSTLENKFEKLHKVFEEKSPQNGMDFWINGGLEALNYRLKIKERTGKAKNIILFIGDGMSVPTLAAARILKGQRDGRTGEESSLGFEKFPFTGLSKTYCVDSQVADSACSATAYLNGVKGNYETIGVTGDVKIYDCAAMNKKEHHTSSIASWAQAAGKATGLVTTTRVSHASPTGVYGHIAHRSWEYDKPVNESGSDPENCWDITKQLVWNEPGKNLKVVLGGGRGTFLPKTVKDPEYNTSGWRNDNRDFVAEWLKDKVARNLSAKYIWNRVDLIKTQNDSTDYLLGLFEPSHMKYHMEANETTEPTLEEMTETAIKKLSKEKNGFFLFVEGGKIDLAHHFNLAHMALDETIEFDKAIQKARQMTSEDDTLIVVTADHAHTMSFNGYPKRGSDILQTLQMGDMDDLPYSTISYANGPGYKQLLNESSKRYNLTLDLPKMKNKEYKFPALLPLVYETHGGDDVAVFASGPWAHLFVGNYEQNVIPLVMAYAARIGPSEKVPFHDHNSSSTARGVNFNWFLTLFLAIFINYFHRT